MAPHSVPIAIPRAGGSQRLECRRQLRAAAPFLDRFEELAEAVAPLGHAAVDLEDLHAGDRGRESRMRPGPRGGEGLESRRVAQLHISRGASAGRPHIPIHCTAVLHGTGRGCP